MFEISETMRDRALRIAKAIEADPRTPAGERDWTVEDVLGVALLRGLDRLEELYIDPKPIEAIRAQAAADVQNLEPRYCEAPDPDGRWHCALEPGHDGHHYSPREMAEVPAWWPDAR